MITHIGEEVARCYVCFSISRKIVNVIYQCLSVCTYNQLLWLEGEWLVRNCFVRGFVVPGDPKKYFCLTKRKMHNKRGIFKIKIGLNYQ